MTLWSGTSLAGFQMECLGNPYDEYACIHYPIPTTMLTAGIGQNMLRRDK